jgi:para-nitrobenzyl esterase
MAIMGDVLFRMPAVRLAEAQHVHRPADTRMYLFAWATPAYRGQLGAPHAVDVPFVFGNLDARGVDRYTGCGEDRQSLADAVQDAWVAFARSADPNHSRLPLWPPYSPDARATFVFDQAHTIQDDPLREAREVWGDVPFDGRHPSLDRTVLTAREIFRSFVPFLV